ncbi:MAG: hypothetical protein J0I47_09955 [Sphingomonas sp.]|uniref:hypothetical protein n=1 Tax=Sphingomonas sp. TaxID=28214 RepID=UPI001ACEC147|nr:hypothetical protein [Sphingomonas sp.]MBN8808537.1 hypothetical protein [Sphingomonas sp.]
MSNLRLTGIGPTPVPPPIPAAALRVRGRIALAMLARHALAPEDAIEFTPAPADVAALAKLRAAGVVRAVPDGRLWLDLVAYHARERRRSRTATIWAFGLAMMIVVVAVLFYRG